MTKPRRLKRYDFTITGHIAVDLNNLDDITRVADLRRLIYTDMIPRLREAGLERVHTPDRKFKDDPVAIAFAEQMARAPNWPQVKRPAEQPTEAGAGDGAHT